MAIYKRITVDSDTQVLIWKIEESLEALKEGLELSPNCLERLSELKSELHKKQFLSIRHLLKEEGFDPKDLSYDPLGKPHLIGEKYVSITHSFEFTGIITSLKPVGIDIEKKRDKILRIANKFTPLEEYRTLANTEAVIRKLTIVWGAKESVYKILNTPGISFLNNIYVEDFEFDDQKTTAQSDYDHKIKHFNIIFTEFEQFTCVYALYSAV